MPRSDYAISPYGRAACPVCGADISLTKAGLLRRHSNLSERQLGFLAPACKGVGQPPKAGA